MEDLGLIPSTHMVAHTMCSINTGWVGGGRGEEERIQEMAKMRNQSLSERCVGKIKVTEAPGP